MKSPSALDMSYILKVIIAAISVKIAELSLQLLAFERGDDISMLPQLWLSPTLYRVGCGSPLSLLCGYSDPALLWSWFS